MDMDLLFKPEENPTMAAFNERFGLLGKYNQYWWKARTRGFEWNKVEKNESYIYFPYSVCTFEYADSISINKSDGSITLNNPSTYSYTSSPGTQSDFTNKILTLIRNKYIRFISGTFQNANLTGVVFRILERAVCLSATSSNGYAVGLSSEQGTVVRITTQSEENEGLISDWYNIQSSNRNAYPDSGIVDNVEYEFLGRPLDNAVMSGKFASGHYIGNGTQGATNPVSITLGFSPSFLIVYTDAVTYMGYASSNNVSWSLNLAMFAKEMPATYINGANKLVLEFSDKGVSYYTTSTGSASHLQLNASGTTYYYIAIG